MNVAYDGITFNDPTRQQRLGYLRLAVEKVDTKLFDMTFYENTTKDGRRTQGLRCLAAEDLNIKAVGYGFEPKHNSSTFNGKDVFEGPYFLSAEERVFGISRVEAWFLFSGNSSTTKEEVLERIDRLLRENVVD